jgi:hypothetical protein
VELQRKRCVFATLNTKIPLEKNMEKITGVIAIMEKDNGCYCNYGKDNGF